MSKRPSRGVSSGVGSPVRMQGRDGDLTIRKTREGKILYVKEHGRWHPINTGVDVAQLKKDVDRLIESVNTLRNENNPFPYKRTLRLANADGTGVKFTNDSGVLKIRNLADSADAIVVAKRINLSSGETEIGGDSTTPIGAGDFGYNTNAGGFAAHGVGILVDSYTTTSGSNQSSTITTVSKGTGDSYYRCYLGSTAKWSFGNDTSDSHKFKIDSGSTLTDTSDFMLDTSGNLTLAGGLTSAGVQTITSTTADQFKVKYDGSNYGLMNVASDGHLEIESVGTAADMTLKADGSMIFYANDGAITLDSSISTVYITASIGELSSITVAVETGIFTIASTASTATTADIILDAGGNIELDAGNGVFVAKNAGTQFSAADSAYAGMIIGMTCVGVDVADDSYDLTTSYVVPDADEFRIVFITPPSEFVEIVCSISFGASSSGQDLFMSLSNHATYGSNSLSHPDQFENVIWNPPGRGTINQITSRWVIQAGNLEAIGASNSLYIAVKTDNTSGTPKLYWGGDASDEYAPLIIKAIALPLEASVRVNP